MPEDFHEVCSSTLNLPSGIYIYKIIFVGYSEKHPDAAQLVASSSNDALTLFGISGSASSPTFRVYGTATEGLPKGLSCLEQCVLTTLTQGSTHIVVTAGRDGRIKILDLEANAHAKERLQLRTPSGKGISAIAQDPANGFLAAGTELLDDGPGDVAVYIWNCQGAAAITSGAAPLLSLVDSHTDTITRLSFFPNQQDTQGPLVSSSTDGLINVWDLQQTDEDEALRAVVNTGSAIQYIVCVGSAANSSPTIETGLAVAISQDEKLDAFNWDQNTKVEPKATVDLRDAFKCDYVINFENELDRTTLIVGACKSETTDTPFVDIYIATSFYENELNFQRSQRLVGGHGEEVVRDVRWFPFLNGIVTCGEDGHVRLWQKHDSDVPMGGTTAHEHKKSQKKGSSRSSARDTRYRPY